MAKKTVREFEGVEISDAVKLSSRRERRKPIGEEFKDAHNDADAVQKYYYGAAGLALLLSPFPFWPEMLLAIMCLLALANGRMKGRLWTAPYRVPMVLGKRGFKDSSTGSIGDGVIYHGVGRGRDFGGQEVWSSARDIQTHRLVVGTTGSGKSEELFGNIFNGLCLGSGALMIDGKASKETFDRMQSLARMFGRDEDFLCLNFIMGGKDYTGYSETKLSNTFNPFSRGSSAQKSSLMETFLPKAEGSNSVFAQRAMQLNKALPKALSFLQECGYVNYNPRLLTEYFQLNNVENLVWFGRFRDQFGEVRDLLAENRHEEFLRLKQACTSLEQVLNDLPGYSQVKPKAPPPMVDADDTKIADALMMGEDAIIAQAKAIRSSYDEFVSKAGDAQTSQSEEASRAEVYRQWGYMTMSLSEPAAMLTYVYGHIFNTEIGELNMSDVFLNRRIVFVMIPSLAESPENMRSLGKISVAAVKTVLGNLLYSPLAGDRRTLLEAQASNAPVPYQMIFDEYGYYVVDGFSVAAAQARSFGVSCTFGMQSTDSLKKASDAEASETIQNTTLRMVGKFAGGEESDMFKMVRGWSGRLLVPMSQSGQVAHSLAFRSETRGTELNYVEQDVVRYSDLNGQSPGQFHMIVGTQLHEGKYQTGESRTIRVKTLYTATIPPVTDWHMNHFVQIKPRDQAELSDIRKRDAQERLLEEMDAEKVEEWAAERGEDSRIHTARDEDQLAVFFAELPRLLAGDYQDAGGGGDVMEAVNAALEAGTVDADVLTGAVESLVKLIDKERATQRARTDVKATREKLHQNYAACVSSWGLDDDDARPAQGALMVLMGPALDEMETVRVRAAAIGNTTRKGVEEALEAA